VIDRISKGRNIAGLLYYLFCPGKSDEHVNQHLVAGWREPASLEPQVRPDGQRDFRRLTGLLNAPLDMTGRRGQDGTVWHCVLSSAPGDRLMSDAEWNEIAAEFMDRMGLARRDDPTGVRWVAVRHGLSKGGIDHIHIAATLARQDGMLPSVHNDFLRARRACQAIERQSGLQVTAPADRTAAVQPTRAETERSERNGSTEPSRVRLRRQVQEAAATARSEADFFARLRDAGALTRERRSDQDPGKVTGYAVALPGHVTRTGDPVWYGGGKLAADLTLPRLRGRWERSRNTDHRAAPPEQDLSPRSVRAFLRSAASSAAERARNEAMFFDHLADEGVLIRCRYGDQHPGQVTGYALTMPGHTDGHSDPIWYSGSRLSPELTLPKLRARWHGGTPAAATVLDPAERRAIWADVIGMTAKSAEQFQLLAGTDPKAVADAAGATADALRVSARTIKGAAGRDLRRAAEEFDRAAREAYGATPQPSRAGDTLRTVAQILPLLGTVSGNPARSLTTLVINLAKLVPVAAELRHLQGREHKAAAARATATRLSDMARHTRATAAVRAVAEHQTRAADVAGKGFPVDPTPGQLQKSRPGRRTPRPGRVPAQPRRPNSPAP
jgi:hypothetical protein